MSSFSITCDFCGAELDAPGGLIFSPPHRNMVSKQHLCVSCYKTVFNSSALHHENTRLRALITELAAQMPEAQRHQTILALNGVCNFADGTQWRTESMTGISYCANCGQDKPDS